MTAHKTTISISLALACVAGAGLVSATGVHFGLPSAVKKVNEKFPKEILLTPSITKGLQAVTPGQSHLYESSGSKSDLGHPVEHRFDWGDGTFSLWKTTTSDLKNWATVGTMPVRAEARCQIHTVVTIASAPLVVIVETVTVPNTPTGTTAGTTGQNYTYSTGGAVSALGHTVEYRFAWDDGTFAPWSTSMSAVKSWSTAGTKQVQAQARCQTHTAITSASTNLAVTITGPAAGAISTVAGTETQGYNADDIPATTSRLNFPYGPAVDSSGNIYIADAGNHRIRKVDAATGVISTVAGIGTPGYTGDGNAATDARLNTPSGIAVDSSGNLFIGDFNNHCIRKVDALTGDISTVAGIGGTGGYNGDTILATKALLDGPAGVAVDSSGNIWIADFDNDRIRKVAAGTGVISTVAGIATFGYNGDTILATKAQLYWPADVAVDTAGNVFIADSGNHRIRKVDAGTDLISTVAGRETFGDSGDLGLATLAYLDSPFGIAVNGAGDLFIADTSNHRVRKVEVSTGTISTVAGTGSFGYNGDGIAATTANIYSPIGVTVDGAGNMFIADSLNHRIRKVVP